MAQAQHTPDDESYLLIDRAHIRACEDAMMREKARADLVTAVLKDLLAANEAVQDALCEGPDVPGFNPHVLGDAQLRVTEAETAARAAIAKAEPPHA